MLLHGRILYNKIYATIRMSRDLVSAGYLNSYLVTIT